MADEAVDRAQRLRTFHVHDAVVHGEPVPTDVAHECGKGQHRGAGVDLNHRQLVARRTSRIPCTMRGPSQKSLGPVVVTRHALL